MPCRGAVCQNRPNVTPCWSCPLITFYYNLAPNPMKVALCLEEMSLPYEFKPVDTRRGEQHHPDFLAVNPNAKVPAIIDQDTGARVFGSNAILLYLAEKTGQFLPDSTPAARGGTPLMADVRCDRRGPVLRPGRPFQALCA